MENEWDRSDKMLDQCLTAMREEGRSVEDCLELYPESAGVESLLRTAARLQSARALHPAPGFQGEALQRLRRQAKSTSRRQASFWPGPGLERKARPLSTRAGLRLAPLLAVLIVAALIAAGIGTFTAAAQTLPGDWLYPVKRAQEEVELSLAPGSAAQADLHLAFASRRLSEATALVNKQPDAALEPILADFDRHVQADLGFLSHGSPLSPVEQVNLANRLIQATNRYEISLAALAPETPAAAQGNLASARQTSLKARRQAEQVIQSGSTATPSRPAIVPSPTATPSQNGHVASPITAPTHPAFVAGPTVTRMSATQAPNPTILRTPLPTIVVPTRTMVPPTLPSNILPGPGATPTKKPTPANLPPNAVVTQIPSSGSGGDPTATHPSVIIIKPTPTPISPQPTPVTNNFRNGK
ncbi:MAG TPA: DUF5667 domain-containing protein [Anaerolineaceae bacterium]|nr:DUF5667 domain-containing protein [Anaerolineaceae bacterium]